MATFALLGVNCRLGLGAVPPLLSAIKADVGLSGFGLGMLTALPVAFTGLLAPPVQRLAGRIGAERALAISLVLMALTLAARLAGSNVVVLLLSSAGVGATISGTSTLVPALIGHHLPHRLGLATGLYSMGISAGTGAASYLAVPLASLLGSWQRSIASWTVVAALTAAIWIALLPGLLRADGRVHSQVAAPSRRLPWRSGTARRITLHLSLQLLVGFSGVAWLVPTFRQVGWSAGSAAGLVVLFQGVQAVTLLVLPYLTDRYRDRRPVLVLSACCTLVAVLGYALAPAQTAIPDAILFGIGLGGGFSMTLLMLVDFTSNREDAARLAAMVFFIAYLVSAVGPLAVGFAYDLTGGFRAGYLVLAVVMFVDVCVAVTLHPRRSLDADELARRLVMP